VISRSDPNTEDVEVWRPHALEEEMLEWKPRLLILLVLLVALASLLGSFGWAISLSFGW
jgi:hypothetical protein